ncbi:alpha/beta hydrolase fold-domain-containing protein [Bombardia bombarda]|uniref:Alpha/beta hydrolase fold-domain-containing protein n=1 Tax=Bombardia bombarda TaxID=252184 RepID=A0AA39W9M3_9PEZI|nr:alpha/beta hydrolase fold-domain-containing protein [Bombardia bombarda]
MSDFSCYGGVSDEWLAIKDVPQLTSLPSSHQEILNIQRLTNDMREKASAAALHSPLEQLSSKPPLLHPLPIYLYFHGGGFIFGTLATEDATCARIAANAHIVVLHVNYRHTPAHTYPVAWHDAADAFEWLHDHVALLGGDAERVVVGGISAGAQLTASLVLEKHLGRLGTSRPAIAGQLLLIPCVVHIDCYEPQLRKMADPAVSSYVENRDAPLLPVAVVRFFVDLLRIEHPQVDDTKLNPGNATDQQVKGLPPTVFGIAGLDPLRDEGLLYAKMLAEAGVATDVVVFHGVPHGFRRFGDGLLASQKWDKLVEDGIQWALGKPAPSGVFEVKVV